MPQTVEIHLASGGRYTATMEQWAVNNIITAWKAGHRFHLTLPDNEVIHFNPVHVAMIRITG